MNLIQVAKVSTKKEAMEFQEFTGIIITPKCTNVAEAVQRERLIEGFLNDLVNPLSTGQSECMAEGGFVGILHISYLKSS